ncbi:hypothetical protein TrRE_jg7599, partial [Triparma retinervis]
MERQIRVLILGDDGVGKSSLVSTFCSQHFPSSVPGIMTTIRVPPIEGAANNEKCVTTILDSQGETILRGMKGREGAPKGTGGGAKTGKHEDGKGE